MAEEAKPADDNKQKEEAKEQKDKKDDIDKVKLVVYDFDQTITR